MSKLTKARQGYVDVVAAAAMSLDADEFWMIGHPKGPLEQTASKDVTYPVRVICQAMDRDWDELRDAGFFLTRGRLALSKEGEAS